ncbi:MAG: hypothetical protein LBC96_00165 [Lachnospiraceae bacterium]|jgi:stage V sporulation protein B|nr:hypothetical protein [Lachnospiraceae bacterium]
MRDGYEFDEKKDPLIGVSGIAMLLCLIFRVPLMSVIGAEGIAFFAPVNELYLITIAFVSGGFSLTTMSMLKYRIGREQYRNAARLFRVARVIVALFSLAVTLFIIIGHRYISTTLFNQDFSRLALLAIVPAVIMMTFVSLLRGYFEGMGTHYPTAHSLILEQAFTIVLGVLMAAYFLDYGEKVAVILHDGRYAPAYGAFGAALGICAAAVISLLHLTVIYLMYRGTFQRQVYRDNSRQREMASTIYRTFLMLSIPAGIFIVIDRVGVLVDQRIFYHFALLKDMGAGEEGVYGMTQVWGNYYGIFLVVVGVLTVLIALLFAHAANNITVSWMREEYGAVRSQLTQTFSLLCVAAIPLAVLTAVLAEPLVMAIGQGDKEIAVPLLQAGSAMIFLSTFAIFWIDILRRFKKTLMLTFLVIGGFIVHIGTLLILMYTAGEQIQTAQQLITRVIVANLIGAAFVFVSGLILVARCLKLRGNWIFGSLRTVIVSILCSAIIGLLSVLLVWLFMDMLGSHVTIIICFAVMTILYPALMMVLRGLSVNELEHLPGGQYLIRLGRRFGAL